VFLGLPCSFHSVIRFSVILVLFWLGYSLSTQSSNMAPILPDVIDALHHAGGAADGVAIIASALAQVEAVNDLMSTSMAHDGALLWASSVLIMLGALETSDGNMWSRPQGALRSIVGSVEHGEDVPWSPAELLELFELVDLVEYLRAWQPGGAGCTGPGRTLHPEESAAAPFFFVMCA